MHPVQVWLDLKLGKRAAREVWVCGAAAYLAFKALAFRCRGENKDAHDLYYVLHNHGDGPGTIAGAFRPLYDDLATRDALAIIEADFATPESVGAMRAAASLPREGDATFLADVAGFARELVRPCERE